MAISLEELLVDEGSALDMTGAANGAESKQSYAVHDCEAASAVIILKVSLCMMAAMLIHIFRVLLLEAHT